MRKCFFIIIIYLFIICVLLFSNTMQLKMLGDILSEFCPFSNFDILIGQAFTLYAIAFYACHSIPGHCFLCNTTAQRGANNFPYFQFSHI